MTHRILLKHTVKDEHIFLNCREKVGFLPRKVLLLIHHVIINESQDVVVNCLAMLLHMLPNLGHYRL